MERENLLWRRVAAFRGIELSKRGERGGGPTPANESGTPTPTTPLGWHRRLIESEAERLRARSPRAARPERC